MLIKELKGWHVLIGVIAFFGVTIAVNAVFITLALRTHPGEDVPRSYMQGLDYNETLSRRAQQAELGWTARANFIAGAAIIAVVDSEGAPVEGLSLAGRLRHSAETDFDCPLVFAPGAEPGVYRAATDCEAEGQWRLEARHEGDPPFEMSADLWLR